MKKILSILFTIICFASFAQTKITAPIITNSLTDTTYSVTYDSLVKGGYRTLLTIWQRDSIPQAERKYGMIVYLRNTDSCYQLKSTSLDNSNWYSFKLGIDTNAVHKGGDSTSAALIIGTKTNQNVQLIANNTPYLIVDTSKTIRGYYNNWGILSQTGDAYFRNLWTTYSVQLPYDTAIFVPKNNFNYIAYKNGIAYIKKADSTINWVDGRLAYYSDIKAGTITGVTAGTNITGGGTSGTVTINADTSTGSTKLATQGFVNRNATNLTASQPIRITSNVINADTTTRTTGLATIYHLVKDSTVLANTKLNISDTLTMLNNRINSITLNSSGVIHNTPINFVRSGGGWTGTMSLSNQSPYQLFGTGNTTSTPTFRFIDSNYFNLQFARQVRNTLSATSPLNYNSITGSLSINTLDSTNVSGLHSQGFYNTKYAAIDTQISCNVKNTLPTVSLTNADYTSAYFQRSNTNNSLVGYNTVSTPGGVGNTILQSSTSQYLTGSDAGLPTGTSITYSASIWFKTTSTSGTLLIWGSSGGQSIVLTGSNSIRYSLQAADNAHASTITTSANLSDNSWHNVIFTITGTSAVCYVDGIAYSNTYPYSYTSTLGGTTGFNTNQDYIYSPIVGSFNQILFYNRLISTTSGSGGSNEVAAIYNSGVGTYSPPTIGLIRIFNFTTGSGTTAFDTNPNGTQYNLTLTGGASWGGASSGNIPTAAATTSRQFIQYKDGVYGNESGELMLGDPSTGNSGIQLWGQTIKTVIGSKIPFYQSNSGKLLLNPTNTAANPTVNNTLEVAGNISIGNGYNGVYSAPTNGAIIQGRALFGTTSDDGSNQVQVSGNLSLKTAGNKINIATGTNASVGTATLTSGTVTVSTTAVTASSIILLTLQNCSNCGTSYISAKTAGTSFVISSTNVLDGSIVAYLIIN